MPGDESLLTGSTSRLLATFRKTGFPCEVVHGDLNIIRYQTEDGAWRLLRGMVSEKLPLFSKQICDDKWWTARLFDELGLPSPATLLVTGDKQITDYLRKYRKVVIKPRSGAHGHGVRMNLGSEPDVRAAIGSAKQFDDQVLIQEQLTGSDIRILVVGQKVVSALERRPASVVGDGVHTVSELIDRENKRPVRGAIGIDTLVKISKPAAKEFLSADTLNSVPDEAAVVQVVGPSNQSLGGTVRDITDQIPSTMRQEAMLLAKHLRMPIAGIDCVAGSIGYYFLEINVSPGIAIHDDPQLNIRSGCFEAYMKLLREDRWWRD